ncbi:hypothetical protein DDB_G0270030 [Dictyostelium discoideum AX4]|uniref:diaminopimelate epimerase n=1 Tax=Dictyostelium discoideum TaxID=44689 RepID=Q55CJ7_DICDI|nr:hypothetical protein DDB_G0270030 [Dictyostelium discoideum AX4]EAL72365.1 hypothetical protein DDB_G0270030 [Dictyostelium discoideum AX4]|eukprot:XP_646484.1 hypothetical protein DDB_G0270030 [Dictyostelium discoideum AX4]
MEPSIDNKPSFRINFTKMHGAGNDFVVFEKNKVERLNGDKSTVTFEEIVGFTTKIAHRKLGIGFDQLIVIDDNPIDKNAAYGMDVINCDGNIEVMCGNGVRCFSKYIVDNKVLSKNLKEQLNFDGDDDIEQIIETKSGIVKTYPLLKHHLNNKDNDVIMVKVNMGTPKVSRFINEIDRHIPKVLTNQSPIESYMYTIDIGLPYCSKLECVYVTVGGNQCVVFIDRNIELGYLDSSYGDHTKFSTIDFKEISDIIQSNVNGFDDIPNVEFVIQSPQDKLENKVISRVVERGNGETLACGTGACGVAISSILKGYCNENTEITVEMPGGKLLIQWNPNNEIFKTGPATSVFKSQILI